MEFKEKVVLISGGASGIGQLHATKLATEHGAKVAILDINKKGLEETSSRSENIHPYYCDVTNIELVRETISKVIADLGPIDRLFNCAAIMPAGLLKDLTAEHINKLMLINYHGMVNICQTVIPDMLKRNSGDVIIYGSTAGMIVTSKFGAYGATKSANNFYTKVLIEENKKSKVRILLVCPPAVDTPLLKQAEDTDQPDIFNTSFFKKYMTSSPEDVVKAVEKSIRRGKKVCYPGSAKVTSFLSRFM
ncbi:SDR family NAD(P)-dependent oxidoreductase [Polaribacter sargassicola]|uniref:SDR family NAD(P)-dependent oxidoreductase n=1 Tax=Polaribacter sargassicola TaxID=2836891 RepID=UPI001F2C5987|nr:SDR family oxidoreductase [Polaribacter sp. DS7-9]MCG1037576.1 SDR family oxidoreductase [Polaribacter sp. DS7-9]